MELTLIAVTLLSLFLAISMGVVAWRLVREERQRSEARLAALAAELKRGEGDPGRGDGLSPPADPEPVVNPAIEPAAPVDGPVADGGLFSSPSELPSTGWARIAALGGMAAVMLVVVTTVFLLSASDDGDAAATAERVRPPLDLIALRHVEEGPFLDISGSVRNPTEAAGVERLSVVAMAFDEGGTLIATRRTPVEHPALAAGTDSAFVVRLLAAGISRYRISFLLGDATIPHVDRRPAEQPQPAGDSS
jgi:hypothetical protein